MHFYHNEEFILKLYSYRKFFKRGSEKIFLGPIKKISVICRNFRKHTIIFRIYQKNWKLNETYLEVEVWLEFYES
jgi:hypothetical protein